MGRLIALGAGLAAAAVAVVPGGAAQAGTEPETTATLSVTKHVNPDSTLQTWSVALTISPDPGGGQLLTKFAEKGNATVSWTIPVGQEFTVTETLPDGWTTDPNETNGCLVQRGGPARLPHAVPSVPVGPPTITFESDQGEPGNCHMYNIPVARLDVAKFVLGDGGTNSFKIEAFSCTSLGQDDECVDKTSVGATNLQDGDKGSIDLPHGIIRIEETDIPAGFAFSQAGCTLDPAAEGDPVFVDTLPATFQGVAQGDVIDCGIQNIELGNLTVTKTVVGPSTPWSFDIRITPDPATGSPGSGSATLPVTNLDNTVQWYVWPGVNYLVEEVLPIGNYTPSALVCTGDDGPPIRGDNGPARVPHGNGDNPNPHDEINSNYGDTISCSITNTQDLAKLSVTKSVNGGTGDWTFKFKIFPTPPGEGNELIASDETPTVTWNNLLPGQQYFVVEEPVVGYSAGALVCTGDTGAQVGPSRPSHVVSGGPLFPPEWPNDSVLPAKDDVISCTITNTATHADLSLTKTADVEQSGLDGTVIWTLHVVNSAAAASNVVVNDTLPLDLQLVDVDAPAGWNCSGSAPGSPAHVGCTKATMAPGESADIVVTTKVVDLGAVELENCAFAGTTTPELSTSNNTGCDSILIEDLPETGSDSSPTAWVGFGLLGLGALFTMITRRRRHARA